MSSIALSLSPLLFLCH